MSSDSCSKKDVEALAGALEKVTVDGGGDVELAQVEEALSASERAVVARLRELQEKHAERSAAFEAAVLELKLKFEEEFKPLYQQRLDLLLAAPQPDATDAKPPPTGTPALPSFWVRALKANRLLADMIEESDEAALAFLKNIQCEWLETQPLAEPEAGKRHPESFRLVFTFAENPYFLPLVLVKEYRLSVAPGGRGAELTSTSSTPIEWLQDKDLTKKTIIRKQRNRKTKQTRTVAETIDADSFFNLFVDHEIPSDDKLEQMEEKDVQELQMVVEADYDIGITIRDKIIPRAVEWFLGQVEDDSDFDDYDMNDDEFDSDDSDDEEDSSEDEAPRGHKGRRH